MLQTIVAAKSSGVTSRYPSCLEIVQASKQKDTFEVVALPPRPSSANSYPTKAAHRPSTAVHRPSTAAPRVSSASTSSAATSTSLSSLPSMSSKSGRGDLVERRRALLQQSAQVEALLAEDPEAAKALKKSASTPARAQPRKGDKWGKVKPGTTWEVPSSADLPTFQSPAVWAAMRYSSIDGKGLVACYKIR